jgi:transposase
MRETVNAFLYQCRTGCQWDLLPHDFPRPGAVKYDFYTWRDDGTDPTIHDLLRWQVREKRTRAWWCSTPRACTLRPGSLPSRQGVVQQKGTGPQARRCAVDGLGVVIAMALVAASAHENAVGITLLHKVVTDTVEKALVDQGFKKPSSRMARSWASR